MEITMKTLPALLATAVCLAVGSVQAQQWDSETFQKSTEMMIPHLSSPMPSSTVKPMDADNRRAFELMRRTDMMMPETAQPRRSQDPHALTALPDVRRPATPLSADDRRAAEFIRRTDQMRPD
jgi:hypothetical protein